MIENRYLKRVFVVVILTVCFILNSGIPAFADEKTGTVSSLYSTDASTVSASVSSSLPADSTAITDELTIDLDYLMDNHEALTNEEIVTRLNAIMDKLALKTPEERNAYSQKLINSFGHGLGMICILPSDKYQKNTDNYYILSAQSVADKAEEVNGLINGYMTKFESLGLNNVRDSLKNHKLVTLEYKEDKAVTKYTIEADLNTVDELVNRGVGFEVLINDSITIIPADTLATYYKSGRENIGKLFIEVINDYNLKIAGDVSDIDTHVYDNYFDIKTYGPHFGVNLSYTGSVSQSGLTSIGVFDAPVKYAFDYTYLKDSINISRLWSYDFRDYNMNRQVYINNTRRFQSINQIQITSVYPGPHGIGTFDRTFDDIKNHWAQGNIEELASRFLINGKTYQNFEPDSRITRAEYAALLTRILGMKNVTYNGEFKDVLADDWYANNVKVAADNGLIIGDNGYFRPNDLITREEMTVILMRAYKLVYGQAATGSVERFEDMGDISPWAVDSIGGAVDKGFILGVTPNTFKPGVTSTRAEAATILLRFLNTWRPNI